MKELLALGGLASSTLILQLVLTRCYSVVYYYHLSFVAVSLSMLGLSLGAMGLFLRPNWLTPDQWRRRAADFAAAFSLSISVCYPLQFYIPKVFFRGWEGALATTVFVTIAAVPFTLSGVAIGLFLTRPQTNLGRTYAADLLGASLGCALVAPLLHYLDPSTTIFLAATLSALTSLLLKAGKPVMGLLCLQLCLVGWSYLRGGITYPYVKGGPDIRREYVGWNSFSRVTVSDFGSLPMWLSFYQGPRPDSRNIRIDAGAGTDIVRCSGDFRELGMLGFDITAMAYHLRPAAKVLILGCGGGRDAATALAMGSSHVVAVEMNDRVVSLLRGRYLDYSGRLAEKIQLVWEEARSYLRNTYEFYDLVQMSLIDTAAAVASGAYLLSEHSLYTVEAWTQILQHLNPDGIFSVTRNRYRGWPMEVDRCLALAIASLKNLGVADPRGHILLFEGEYAPHNDPNTPVGLTTLLVCRRPFLPQELEKARSLEQFGFVERDWKRGNLSPASLRLLDPQTHDAALAQAPIDISAPTDNRPYFFFHLKLGRLLRGDFTALVYERSITILPQLLFGLTILSGLLLAIPLKLKSHRVSLRNSVYFASIGIGFMAVEVALLQVMSLYLGHPLYSMAVVLFGLLVASGAGSWLSDRIQPQPVLWSLPLAITAVALLHPLAFAWPLTSNAARIGLALALLLPLGGLMGQPFPMAMQRIQKTHPESAPWCWALNGATSVLCSVAATAIALMFGLQAVFALGALAYAAAALSLPATSLE